MAWIFNCVSSRESTRRGSIFAMLASKRFPPTLVRISWKHKLENWTRKEKMVIERKIPCRVHPGASAMCRQWHKLKPETNLLACLISGEGCLRSALFCSLHLYRVVVALIIFCRFWRLWGYISTSQKKKVTKKKKIKRTADFTEDDSGIFLHRIFTGISWFSSQRNHH